MFKSKRQIFPIKHGKSQKKTNKTGTITPFTNQITNASPHPIAAKPENTGQELADSGISSPLDSDSPSPDTSLPKSKEPFNIKTIADSETASEYETEDTINIPAKFYFPGIDRKKSERILLQTNIEDNTFLIRDGREKNYVISVRIDSRVDHFIIYFQLGDYSLEDSHTFATIEDLVNYYSKNTSRSKIFLSKCITEEEVEQDVVVTDIASKLSLSFTSSRQVMLPAREGDELNLHCKISPSDTVMHTPLSACCVIDVSGSMRSHMLIMESSLKALLSQFRDFDKLSIVTFSNSSVVELELTCMDDVGRKKADGVISRLKVRGSTNIEAGLLNGIDIFSKVVPLKATPMESIVLFTDGIDDRGSSAYPLMKTAAEDAMKRIQTVSAKLSVQRHIVISVVPFGDAPKELKLLSDAGNGLFIPTNVGKDSDLVEVTAESFASIIGSSRSTAANDITINIQANSQIQLYAPVSLPDNYKLTQSGANFTISIPHIICGNSIDILFPMKFTENSARFIHCEVLANVKVTAYSLITKTQVCLKSNCGVIMDSTYNEFYDSTARERNTQIQLFRTLLIQTLEKVKEAGPNRSPDDICSLIKPMLEKLLNASMSNEELIKCFVETLLVVNNEMDSPQNAIKILEQLKQAHSYQTNNTNMRDLPIPRSSKILADLKLDFNLRDYLDLSVYDGQEQKKFRNRVCQYFEKIYADPKDYLK